MTPIGLPSTHSFKRKIRHSDVLTMVGWMHEYRCIAVSFGLLAGPATPWSSIGSHATVRTSSR